MALRGRPLAVLASSDQAHPAPLTKDSLQMQRNFSFSERQTVAQIKSGLNRHREKLRWSGVNLSDALGIRSQPVTSPQAVNDLSSPFGTSF